MPTLHLGGLHDDQRPACPPVEADRSAVSAPHRDGRASVATRRGGFWLTAPHAVATSIDSARQYVEWECPDRVTRPYPLVFVHGGGGQGTDWTETPDGRAGWARRFVQHGYATYVVDRVEHGRARSSAQGNGAAPTSEQILGLFAPAGQSGHTQWPTRARAFSSVAEQLVASAAPLPADRVASEQADALLLSKLLEQIGPAVLITHSAGAPAGWLTAAENPGLVRGIVAVEPIGPPFREDQRGVPLAWGLTHAPMPFYPSPASAKDIREDTTPRVIPGMHGVPMAVVTGSASRLGAHGEAVTEFLCRYGARATHLSLGARGVTGNGHGLIFEQNSDDIADLVAEWIDVHL